MSITEFINKYDLGLYAVVALPLARERLGGEANNDDAINLCRILDDAGYSYERPTFLVSLDATEETFSIVCNILARNPRMGFTRRGITEEDRENIAYSDNTGRLVAVSQKFADFASDVKEACGVHDASVSDEIIKELSIDIETYSSNDIANGVYKYAEAEDFEILLFSYSVNRGAVLQVDIAQGEEIPEKIIAALIDPTVVKTAFNAAFERICISHYLGLNLDPDQWQCTMVRSAMLGLPGHLKDVGAVLKLKDQKMTEGVALIKYFSCPCRATKINGGRTRNMPSDNPEKWDVYKKYNRRDVEVEIAIRKIVDCEANPITDMEKDLYIADQRINDRGVMVDTVTMTNAIMMDDIYKGRLNAECQQITGLDNPNSVAQLKSWIGEKTGREITSLTKDTYGKLMDGASEEVKRVLTIRTEMGKTSTAKYTAMREALCRDERVHGMLQFYGSRTGRWAGRIVQLQNLPQNHILDLDFARDILVKGDLQMMEMAYGNVPDTLSQLIRTTFIAKEKHTFIVCDFSAIEARVIAWLAGEQWRMDVFRGDGKIYEASAAQMFHVPIASIGHDSPLRKKGKISELALGYQGSVGALEKMGGEKFLRLFVKDQTLESERLSEAARPHLMDIVDNWRKASPMIVKLWADIEDSFKNTYEDGRMRRLKQGDLILRKIGENLMQIRLPSGRWLSYPYVHWAQEDMHGKKLAYMGMNQTTHHWEEIPTYGGKLTENIVQAIARDCLGQTILRLEEKKYPVVFHIHDECICEVPNDGSKTLDEVKEIFSTPMPFAQDLPLKGSGYVTKYYLKD